MNTLLTEMYIITQEEDDGLVLFSEREVSEEGRECCSLEVVYTIPQQPGE